MLAKLSVLAKLAVLELAVLELPVMTTTIETPMSQMMAPVR